jgi:hypothetical protein
MASVALTVGSQGSPRAGLAEFTTTHWSVVLAACQQDSPGAGEALAQLCRTYWYPLYAFIRRQGSSPQDAEDLTQGRVRSPRRIQGSCGDGEGVADKKGGRIFSKVEG